VWLRLHQNRQTTQPLAQPITNILDHHIDLELPAKDLGAAISVTMSVWKNSWLFEIASVLVRLDHVARVIVNADDGIM
jgi:hypothetical protein